MIPARHLLAWMHDYAYATRRQARLVLGSRLPGALAHGDRAPVVLLPGVYEKWHFLEPIARRLNAAGHPVHAVAALGRNRRPVPDMAAAVQDYLRRAGLQDVILVAHSKGGLIGKHVMAVDDTEQRVASMVAIAAPFGGSRYARYLPSRTLRAFSPTEVTLAMLAGRQDVNARITSIFGLFDPHIPEGSVLEGADNVELPVLGHFRILGDPTVIAAVAAAVDGPVPGR